MNKGVFGTRLIDKIENLNFNNKKIALISGDKELDKLLDLSRGLKKKFTDINIFLLAKSGLNPDSLPENIFKGIIISEDKNKGIVGKIKKISSLIKALKKNNFDIVGIFYENTLKDINLPGEVSSFLSNSQLVMGFDGKGKLYLLENKFFIYKFFYFLLFKLLPFILKIIINVPVFFVVCFCVTVFWIVVIFFMFVSNIIHRNERLSY